MVRSAFVLAVPAWKDRGGPCIARNVRCKTGRSGSRQKVLPPHTGYLATGYCIEPETHLHARRIQYHDRSIPRQSFVKDLLSTGMAIPVRFGMTVSPTMATILMWWEVGRVNDPKSRFSFFKSEPAATAAGTPECRRLHACYAGAARD